MPNLKKTTAVSHLAITNKMLNSNRGLFRSLDEWENYEPCKRQVHCGTESFQLTVITSYRH
jgi:hypothetical protein